MKEIEIKVYKFDYQTYGNYYIVASTSKEDALLSLKAYLQRKMREDGGSSNYWKAIYEEWKNSDVYHLPEGYSIEVYNINRVIPGEYA